MGVRLFLLIGMLLLGGGCKLMDIVDEGQSSDRIDLYLTKQSLLLDHIGGYLYVSVGNLGLDIIDISNEKAPRVVKNYRTEDRTYAITRSGERLFLANGTEGGGAAGYLRSSHTAPYRLHTHGYKRNGGGRIPGCAPFGCRDG